MFEVAKHLSQGREGFGRRIFLIAAGLGIAGSFAYRWWREQPLDLVERPVRFITPNREFYRVSINPTYPEKVAPRSWDLEIKGLSGVSRRYSLGDLSSRNSTTVYRTLMCISNPVGGDSIGNAAWTVTPLGALLEPLARGVGEGLRVAFYAADGFHSSVPLRVALDPEAYLAWEMNGAPLPREHGYPLRVLLPDKYGMKQPRWLERIEITGESVSGHWEKWGWSDESNVRMTARIDGARPTAAGRWQVAGIAYCGAQPVAEVELSYDGGELWRRARLASEALPNAWALWEFDWDPPGEGEYVLAVRVTDAVGNHQTEGYSGSYPSGSTGFHQVIVRV